MPTRRLFCFGLGYCARVLAARLRAEGWRIAGTVRGADEAARLSASGIEAFVFAPGAPLAGPRDALAGTTHLLSSIPPEASGDSVIARHGADIAACRELAWVGYLSTTGVYGDRGGGWVDEETRPMPSGARGQRRVAAEEAWRELGRGHGIPIHVFRLAGIYGPGRNALVDVRAGTARRVHKPGQVFGRIHVDDIAAVLAASMAHPRPGSIYNVCDDLPAPPDQVVSYACELLGVAPPPLVPFDSAGLSPMARSFYRDNKRVSNRRIKDELGVRLAYPDYRAGLKALLEGGVAT